MKLKELFQEGVNDPHIFKAVFMAGGSGSGKSYVARNMLGGTGLKMVNSDIAFEYLMNKENLRKDMPSDEKEKRDQTRDRAKAITGKQEDLYIQNRLGLVIDGTGKDLTKIAKIKEQLEKIGYDTRMLFINTNLETTLQRNQDRFDKEGGRRVDQEMATGIWKQTQDNMMKYQQVFGADSFFIIDNSGGLEDPDRKHNFETVYNELQKFINSKPTQATATHWIKSNKEKKQYNSPVSSTKPEDEGDFYSTSTFKSRGGSARQTSDFAKRAVLAKGKEKITSFSPPD